MNKVEGEISIVEKILEFLTEDHPFYSDKNFHLFTQTFIEESFTAYILDRNLANMLISAYEYFSKGDIPKIRVINNPDVTILKSSTIIEAHATDIKFLLDSIREFLNESRYKAKLIINPIFSCTRNETGEIIELKLGTEGLIQESFIHIEIEKVEENRLQSIKTQVESMLEAVSNSVEDYPIMIGKLKALNQKFKTGNLPLLKNQDFSLYEGINFLDWLLEDNFVFLGYRCYEVYEKDGDLLFQVASGSGKGILRDTDDSLAIEPVSINSYPQRIRERLSLETPLIIEKSPGKSIVHRRVPMDFIEIREYTNEKQLTQLHRFLGLFTRKALFSQVKDISLLNSKLNSLVEQKRIVKGSTLYREVLTVFNSLPKEELFFSSIDELDSLIQLIVSAYQKQEIRIFFRLGFTGTAVSVIIAMPEKYFSSKNLDNLAKYFKKFFQAETIQYYQTMSHAGFWQIHFFFTLTDPDSMPYFTTDGLEEEIGRIVKIWEEVLVDKIHKDYPHEISEKYYHRYAAFFPKEYQTVHSVEMALHDIALLELFFKSGTNQYDIIPVSEDASIEELQHTNIRIYSQDNISLSTMMPILENLGLKVMYESAFHFTPKEGDIYLYVFGVTDLDGHFIDKSLCEGVLKEALEKVMANQLENGYLNALITKAGMNYKQINLLRVYYNYYFQIERIFTRKTVARIMIHHSEIIKLLFRFFDYKFNPGYTKTQRDSEVPRIRADILDKLKEVTDINEDRILKAIYNIMEATLRTNYYSRTEENSFLISIKIDSKSVLNMPEPKPLYEIFVYSYIMEGIHLRGGKIARGGLRWSDRIDDFRMEILALMKTQMTKNTVIVPVGSKGGFVFKGDWQSQNDPNFLKTHYQRFISGLLDLTDNIVNNDIDHPENVICYDGKDPYLVVAADKGTAHLSDSANEVSRKYGFWLDDAFASGGSHGYDHKKEGITAKGAWECVRRHFIEIEKDIQEEEFTVIGIGDMSGDVFGNGMLLSRKILLKGAFNHVHIFIDPNPDAESSFEERDRLFKLPKSTWLDYNQELISEGGGIFQRNEKAISLSNEIKEYLNTDLDEVNGETLIQLILKSDIELLWNGGIGTYVKATSETHGQVGDKANDHVRIDASDLKAKVIGEGGNLGFTQLARVEIARSGGHVNTDFIDNSGGVDISDHEVNLKILFNQLLNRNLIKDMDERNGYLEHVENDLMQKVMEDNYLQSIILSIDGARSLANLDRFRELIRNLVQKKLLDAKAEFIPSDKEISTYKTDGIGLLRPQLAVLLAYEKMRVYHKLLASDIPDLEYCKKYLLSYFPELINEKFIENILNHQLKREIIATVLANHIINSAGITTFFEIKRDTGEMYASIVGAYLVAEEILDLPALRKEIYQLDFKIPTQKQYRKLRRLEKMIRFMVIWNLTYKQYLIPDEEEIKTLKDDVWEFQAQLFDDMTIAEKEKYEQRLREDIEMGIPESLAKRILAVESLENVFLYLPLNKKFDRSLLECHNLCNQVDEKLDMDLVMSQLEQVHFVTIWDQLNYNYLRTQFQFARYFICKNVLKHYNGEGYTLFESKGNQFMNYHQWVERLKEAESKRNFHPFTVILKFMWNLIN